MQDPSLNTHLLHFRGVPVLHKKQGQGYKSGL
jgi:hypothetical protein